MSGLDSHPTRLPLPIFDTLGHFCVGVLIVVAVVAAVGVVAWFRVQQPRYNRLIVRLWVLCAFVGVAAAAFAVLFLT